MQIKLTFFVSSSLFCTFAPRLSHMRREYIMPKIMKTIAPVDSLSGMFGKRSHSIAGKAIIANIRKRGGAWNDGAPFMYFSVLTKTTAMAIPTQNVKDLRAKFKAVAAGVLQRLADPNQMPLDQIAFREQSKYKTLRQFVWHLVSKEYDQQNG